jgi:hypothetical protein
MPETMIRLEIPVNDPLKDNAKNEILNNLISAFKKAGMSNVKVVDSCYIDKRSSVEPLYLSLLFLGAVADITSIALAVWTFLKERDNKSYINLEVGDLRLRIRANLSDEAIIALVKEAKKSGNKKKKSIKS